MTLDLPEPYKTELMALVRRHAPEHEVLAFGSRLGPDHHEGSDLDVALRHPAQPQKRLEGMAALREAISESNIPIMIDLHDWAALPASFQQEIERAHVRL